MSDNTSVDRRLRPVATYLAVWAVASVIAVGVWASTAGAQEPYRGSLPVTPSGMVTAGDAFSPEAVVFVELQGSVTLDVFADRACDRRVASNTFDIVGLETPGPQVVLDEPGIYYARTQVENGPRSKCERLTEVVEEPALEVSQDGSTVRATSNLRGVATAVLMESGCTGGALGSTQWRADTRTSQSPPLAAPTGRPAGSVQVTISGDTGRTVTTCLGWASKAQRVTTTTADPTIQEELVLAEAPAKRTTTTQPGPADPLATANPASTTTTTGVVTTTVAPTTTAPEPSVAGVPDLADTGPTRTGVAAALGAALLLLVGAMTVLIANRSNKERGTS
jgi:hypothetical protein